jgi:hypothetical protein
MGFAMGMLKMIAPLCRAVDDNPCRLSTPALATSERTVVKMGILEVPCKGGAVLVAFATGETAGCSLRLRGWHRRRRRRRRRHYLWSPLTSCRYGRRQVQQLRVDILL